MDRRFVSQVCPACFPAKISKWILLLCCSSSSCCYSWFSNKTEDANNNKKGSSKQKNREAPRMLFSNAKKKYFIDFRNQRNDFWKMFYFVAVDVVVAIIACRIKM